MLSLGKTIRLNRLKNQGSGRILTIAIDHAPSYGVLAGLEDIGRVIHKIASAEPDAMVMMKGVAENCFKPYSGNIALILKCSTLSPYHPTRDVGVSSVEDALRMGADAIAMALTVGSEQQVELIANLSKLVIEAERVGLPVIVHAYPNGELVPVEERFTTNRVSYAARMAMELGVDVVKTFYTGSPETFSRVVEMASPALVVAAGGPKMESDLDVLQMAYDVVQAGAAGITFGRNVWQSRNVPQVIQALKQILHNGKTASEIMDETARSFANVPC
jgi:fructose-bisphosphate aldolase, class I